MSDNSPQPAAEPQSPTQIPFNYLRPYGFITFFKAALKIYKENLKTLLLLSIAPVIMAAAFALFIYLIGFMPGAHQDPKGMLSFFPIIILLAIVVILISVCLQFAQVAAVAEAVRGVKSGFWDSIRRVWFAPLLNTCFTELFIGIAVFLLIVPLLYSVIPNKYDPWYEQLSLGLVLAGIYSAGVLAIFGALFLLVIQVCLLEGSWAIDAMMRSMVLGKGFYLRNLTFFLVPLAVNLILSRLGLLRFLQLIVQPLLFSACSEIAESC